jgi:hypothetical protein
MTWRDAIEKQPGSTYTVLVWDEKHGHQLASYSKIGKMWIPENRKIKTLAPTHWQPLPSAPSVEETTELEDAQL